MPDLDRTRSRFARALVIVIALLVIAWLAPFARRRWIHAVLSFDAIPTAPVELPKLHGVQLPPTPKIRVILIDGLAASVATVLPNWRAVCSRGAQLVVDVGFPTVSLPVEAELWSGLTQQQSGIVFRSDMPLIPALRGIPASVADSRAVAEDHGWIVRSLGFAHTEPIADPDHVALDNHLEDWHREWIAHARAAVTSDAQLVFVHVLRVDTAGHRAGRESPLYRVAAGTADSILGELVAAEPDARWFILSDHGHLAGGGHGGEELELRQVEGCIAGPGVPHIHGGPVHIVDIARSLADSLGVTLAPEAKGRVFTAALGSPLHPDQALPAVPLQRAALAIVIVVIGLALSLAVRKWWLAPWWFVVGVISFVVVRGEPTLSTSMVWAPTGQAMYVTWLPSLVLAILATWLGLRTVATSRVVLAQLALPCAAVAAAITASGAWPLVFGHDIAPVTPHVTAWLSPLVLIAAHGCAAVALAVLARFVRWAFDPRSRPETPSSAPAAS